MAKQNHSSSSETNSTTTLSIPRLRAILRGRVIAPEDAAYDEAREHPEKAELQRRIRQIPWG